MGPHSGKLFTATVIASFAVIAVTGILNSSALHGCGAIDLRASLVLYLWLPLLVLTGLLSILSTIAGFAARRTVHILGSIALIVLVVPTFSLLERPLSALDSPVVSQLRTINTAQVSYQTSAGTFGDFTALKRSGFLDAGFEQGPVLGYRFSVLPGKDDFIATAALENPRAGCFDYFVDSEGVVRYSKDPAKAPPEQAGQAVP